MSIEVTREMCAKLREFLASTDPDRVAEDTVLDVPESEILGQAYLVIAMVETEDAVKQNIQFLSPQFGKAVQAPQSAEGLQEKARLMLKAMRDGDSLPAISMVPVRKQVGDILEETLGKAMRTAALVKAMDEAGAPLDDIVDVLTGKEGALAKAVMPQILKRPDKKRKQS